MKHALILALALAGCATLAPHVDGKDAGRGIYDALGKAPPKPKDPGRLPPDWPCWPCR